MSLEAGGHLGNILSDDISLQVGFSALVLLDRSRRQSHSNLQADHAYQCRIAKIQSFDLVDKLPNLFPDLDTILNKGWGLANALNQTLSVSQRAKMNVLNMNLGHGVS
jgi:hypothetical protein